MSSIRSSHSDTCAEAQAPSASASTVSRRRWKILPFSAGSDSDLQIAGKRLAKRLVTQPNELLDDVAWSMLREQATSSHRCVLVCRETEEAVAALAGDGDIPSKRIAWGCSGIADKTPSAVAFMFPGAGEQYFGMGSGLYETEPVFRHHFDLCAIVARQASGIDLRGYLYSESALQCQSGEGEEQKIDLAAMMGRRAQTAIADDELPLRRATLAHPALFATEYALAQLWMSWGITPSAMIGYSLGEYTAACIAGVMSVEDAIRIVVGRASLIERSTPGAMLAVAMPEAELCALLQMETSIAATNAPSMCVVAGPLEGVISLKTTLAASGVAYRDVNSCHAFHTPMMEAISAELVALFDGIKLRPPTIPYISTLTGDWIRPEQAVDPHYWARHTCKMVRFSDGIQCLNGAGRYAFIEIGPGHTLASFVHQQAAAASRNQTQVAQSLPAVFEKLSDVQLMARSLGSLWCSGVAVDWLGYYSQTRPGSVSLPTGPSMGLRSGMDFPADTRRSVDDAPGKVALRSVVFEGGEGPLDAEMLLPRIGLQGIGGRPAHIDPKGDIEKLVARAWSEILGVEEVGRDDNFIFLGGNSLLGTKLLNRIRDMLQLVVPVPLKALFEHTTLRAFAAFVEHLLLEEIEALSDEEVQEQILATEGVGEVPPVEPQSLLTTKLAPD